METDESSSANYGNARGRELGRDRRYEDAVVCFDKAIQLDAGHFREWYNKALCLEIMGLYSESLACFTEATFLEPGDRDAANKLREVAQRVRSHSYAFNTGKPASGPRQLQGRPGSNFGILASIAVALCVLLVAYSHSHGHRGPIKKTAAAATGDRLPAGLHTDFIPIDRPRRAEKPHNSVSLRNGTVLVRNGAADGLGTLTVDNGLELDATVKMVRLASRKLYCQVYIRRHSQVPVAGVPAGDYELEFEQGLDWDGKHFRYGRECSKFDDPLAFTETTQQDESGREQIIYSVKQVTLHSVPEGHAHTSPMTQQEFDETD